LRGLEWGENVQTRSNIEDWGQRSLVKDGHRDVLVVSSPATLRRCGGVAAADAPLSSRRVPMVGLLGFCLWIHDVVLMGRFANKLITHSLGRTPSAIRTSHHLPLSESRSLFNTPSLSVAFNIYGAPSKPRRNIFFEKHIFLFLLHSKNKTPVLGNAIPIFGVKLNRG